MRSVKCTRWEAVILFNGVVRNIPRKATVSQLGRRECPGVSWGASGRLVYAVATAGVMVHVTMQAMFGRPTHLQQVSSPQVRP